MKGDPSRQTETRAPGSVVSTLASQSDICADATCAVDVQPVLALLTFKQYEGLLRVRLLALKVPK